MQHDYYPHNVQPGPTHVHASAPFPPASEREEESDPPPYVSSGTYHEQNRSEQQRRWALPAGWKTAHRESDGRIYYWNLSTGQSSWSHPSALHPETHPHPPRRPLIDLPFFRSSASTTAVGQPTPTPTPFPQSTRHPDSHQCCALFASMAFPPLGVCALVHSCLVGRRWNQGRYGESYEHSRQAYTYAWWSVVFFLLLLLWFLCFHGQWPDFRGFFQRIFQGIFG